MAVALRPTGESSLVALAREGPDASLGRLLDRDIASRAIVTAAGAGAAWLFARLSGDEERARTVGLVALVGTQLGQTLASGGVSAPVLTTSLASAAVLGAVVQTPGISQIFGCRPLGPFAWATAALASGAATGASVILPGVVEALGERLGVGAWLGAAASGAGPALSAPPSALPAAPVWGDRAAATTESTGRSG